MRKKKRKSIRNGSRTKHKKRLNAKSKARATITAKRKKPQATRPRKRAEKPSAPVIEMPRPTHDQIPPSPTVPDADS